jgi:Asp-tRNA(Asn)/Glu-tRNA(Gln) amidotransferase C subunit
VKDNRVRPDVVVASDWADALVDQAPEREDRFFVIPNVL